MSNLDILRMFRDRDENAVAEAGKRYGNYCLYIADNVLRSRQDAEECVNDALFAAWRSIPPQEPENLRIYLGKLTREIAIDRWRTNNRQKRGGGGETISLDDLEEVVSGGGPDGGLEEAELSRVISQYLYSLGETKRNVFIRRYWYYDPVEVICHRFGFKKSKVLMMLKRTRDDLARYLKKEGYDL